jgi:hypothetical protein
MAHHSLVEKPKVGRLQMDWLRSEDLKEEKNVTAPTVIIAVESLFLPRPLPFVVFENSSFRGVPVLR